VSNYYISLPKLADNHFITLLHCSNRIEILSTPTAVRNSILQWEKLCLFTDYTC